MKKEKVKGERIKDKGKNKTPRRVLWALVIGIFLFLFDPGSIPGQEAAELEFRPALPGWQYRFPADHGAHKEFKTEWWYYNGQLRDARGGSFGYQLTFFRVGLTRKKPEPLASRWRATEIYFAHLAVTDRGRKAFQFREKAGRGNLGLAGADTGRYRVWIDHWQAEERQGQHVLTAGDRSLGVQLILTPTARPVIHGFQGISRKGEGVGRASHYYSLTRLKTKGQIRIQGETREVEGLSWMDHEFGSNQLGPRQVGWDWFALQLSEPLDLMLYQLRLEDGRTDPHSSGTLILPDRQPRPLRLADFAIRVFRYWNSPNSGARYPAGWEISLPGEQLFLRVLPWVADQELLTGKSTRITYWEGAVAVSGTWRGRPVQGNGYVEMTGYDRRFPPRI